MGMVEGDSKTMEAYLNSRGDPTRKLSNPEAQLFAKPGPGVYNTNHQLSALKTCSQSGVRLPSACESGRVGSMSATCLRPPPTPCHRRLRTCPPRLREQLRISPQNYWGYMSCGYTLLNYWKTPSSNIQWMKTPPPQGMFLNWSTWERERRENLFCLFTNYHNSFNRQRLRITYQYILQ